MRFISLAIMGLSLSAFSQTRQESLIFLDLNDNPKEIAVAQASAKAKGLRLVVYPKGKEAFDQKKLEGLLKSTSFKSLVVSGHNGGASYHGEKGDIEISDLIAMVQESPSVKKMEALYLLGCNGANKSKIYFWKEGLPNLRMIAGYDGFAPLGKDVRGLKYFGSTLAQQNQILQGKDKTQIKGLLETLSSVNVFDVSVYVSCSAENQEYLYLPKRKGAEKFTKLNSAECTGKISEFKKTYLPKLKQYLLGDLEPTTTDPSKGFLREAYLYVRQNEHCIASKEEQGAFDDIDGDSLLFLRFHKNVNLNFAEYYHDALKQELADMDLLINDPAAMAQREVEAIKANNLVLKDLKAHPEKIKELLASETKLLKDKLEALEKSDPAFRACIADPQPSCTRFMAKYMERSSLEQSIGALKDWELNVDMGIAQEVDLEVMKGVYGDQAKKKEIIEYRDVLARAVNEPEKLTRKDVLALSKNQSHLLQFNPIGNTQRMSNYVQALEGLDGYGIPFSWHERIAGKEAEAPRSFNLKKEGYFKGRFPKELEPFARSLDLMAY